MKIVYSISTQYFLPYKGMFTLTFQGVKGSVVFPKPDFYFEFSDYSNLKTKNHLNC